MPRPLSTEFAAYYEKYVSKIEGDDLFVALDKYTQSMNAFLSAMTEEKADYAYADGKWTVKQSLQHVVDTERIFAYRALRIARRDKVNLPGFEQDDFAQFAEVKNRTVKSLAEEMMAVRAANLTMFKSFSTADLAEVGSASNNPVSANAIGFILLGHWQHHEMLFKEKYGL
jgi:uncharacterized damage-inducible protein DinB